MLRLIRISTIALALSLCLAGSSRSASIQIIDGSPVAISADGQTALVNGIRTEYGKQSAGIRLRAARALQLGDQEELDRIRPFLAELRRLQSQGLHKPGLVNVQSGEILRIDALPANSLARDLSGDGATIVGKEGPRSFTRPFRWRESDGVQWLESPTSPSRWLDINGTSADGSIVVGSRTGLDLLGIGTDVGPDIHALLWNKSGQLEFLAPKIRPSYANGISEDGEIIVGHSWIEGRNEAVRWSPNSPAERILPPTEQFVWSSAQGVSGDGQIIFGQIQRENKHRPNVFIAGPEGKFLDLEALLPEAIAAELHALSYDGQLAVGQAYIEKEDHPEDAHWEAVLWDSTRGARPLREILIDLGVDMKDIQLEDAIDISADGRRILGLTSDGQAFIAIIPEPSTAIFMGLGLIGLSWVGSRSKLRRNHRVE